MQLLKRDNDLSGLATKQFFSDILVRQWTTIGLVFLGTNFVFFMNEIVRCDNRNKRVLKESLNPMGINFEPI